MGYWGKLLRWCGLHTNVFIDSLLSLGCKDLRSFCHHFPLEKVKLLPSLLPAEKVPELCGRTMVGMDSLGELSLVGREKGLERTGRRVSGKKKEVNHKLLRDNVTSSVWGSKLEETNNQIFRRARALKRASASPIRKIPGENPFSAALPLSEIDPLHSIWPDNLEVTPDARFFAILKRARYDYALSRRAASGRLTFQARQPDTQE
ncbi:hypothetical protein CEXT_511901 [Caerostris extrusa]|uniref:Uncharacterized protein n=1 Tax=Caerostris extrusa TaxID=172846 RepID=A0AAV4NQZ8_CAEEX|nr:hypothetical protein CEXT_511901 [Caerostris extrusa]